MKKRRYMVPVNLQLDAKSPEDATWQVSDGLCRTFSSTAAWSIGEPKVLSDMVPEPTNTPLGTCYMRPNDFHEQTEDCAGWVHGAQRSPTPAPMLLPDGMTITPLVGRCQSHHLPHPISPHCIGWVRERRPYGSTVGDHRDAVAGMSLNRVRDRSGACLLECVATHKRIRIEPAGAGCFNIEVVCLDCHSTEHVSRSFSWDGARQAVDRYIADRKYTQGIPLP